MKNRDLYLNRLIEYQNKPLIKVITGIRRCGKSTLLSLFKQHLIASGVPDEQIIHMNFESLVFDEIHDYMDLHLHLSSKITTGNDTCYLLLDEIQQVKAWEKVINSLLVDANVDIYLTGSNAYLLSSELSTLLSGRYVEINMYPLSFKEYVDFFPQKSNETKDSLFNQYLEFGGFPVIGELMDHPETIAPVLEGIYNTVLMKDVIERNQVRDPALLENILKYIAANVGNIVSTKKISDYLTSSGRKTTSDTIDNYLKMLENAYIIYKASRFDLKGKLFLKTLEKYYIVDTGIRNQLTGLRNTDYGHVLENVIYLELIRRGYRVSIGKIGPLEVDFVAEKANQKKYFQVSATILDENTRERELRPLENIPDHYSKSVLTMDKSIYKDYEGIEVVNIIDFLLE